ATATPLTLHTLDGRYATALFNAALKSNQLPTIASDLEKLSKSLDTNPNLNTVLGSPMVNQNEKIKHLTPFLTSCHPISKRFFNVVADNNRLNLLPNMIASFASLMQAHRGEVNVVITSVKVLFFSFFFFIYFFFFEIFFYYVQ
ncbi:ATP synthase F0 subcomplex subunit OSCP atp5, partial [Coelomomyces lativittatus]